MSPLILSCLSSDDSHGHLDGSFTSAITSQDTSYTFTSQNVSNALPIANSTVLSTKEAMEEGEDEPVESDAPAQINTTYIVPTADVLHPEVNSTAAAPPTQEEEEPMYAEALDEEEPMYAETPMRRNHVC